MRTNYDTTGKHGTYKIINYAAVDKLTMTIKNTFVSRPFSVPFNVEKPARLQEPSNSAIVRAVNDKLKCTTDSALIADAVNVSNHFTMKQFVGQCWMDAFEALQASPNPYEIPSPMKYDGSRQSKPSSRVGTCYFRTNLMNDVSSCSGVQVSTSTK